MLELCFKSAYLSFGNCTMLLIPQSRVLSGSLMLWLSVVIQQPSVTHLLWLHVSSALIIIDFIFFLPQKENCKLNAAIITCRSGGKRPFVAVNCLCVSKVLVRSSQQKEKSFYRSPFTLGSLSSCPQFHYQPFFSKK